MIRVIGTVDGNPPIQDFRSSKDMEEWSGCGRTAADEVSSAKMVRELRDGERMTLDWNKFRSKNRVLCGIPLTPVNPSDFVVGE